MLVSRAMKNRQAAVLQSIKQRENRERILTKASSPAREIISSQLRRNAYCAGYSFIGPCAYVLSSYPVQYCGWANFYVLYPFILYILRELFFATDLVFFFFHWEHIFSFLRK